MPSSSRELLAMWTQRRAWKPAPALLGGSNQLCHHQGSLKEWQKAILAIGMATCPATVLLPTLLLARVALPAFEQRRTPILVGRYERVRFLLAGGRDLRIGCESAFLWGSIWHRCC